jgi:hypothetical protein
MKIGGPGVAGHPAAGSCRSRSLASYQRALAPKRLVNLAGGHFDAYVADFEAASKAAVEWFTQHLAPE